MLVLNGIKFAPGPRAVVDSLFQQGGTASGWYSRTWKGIELYNLQGVKIGGINPHRVLYRSFKLNGKWFHQAANPDGIPEWGSYGQRCRDIDAVMDELTKNAA